MPDCGPWTSKEKSGGGERQTGIKHGYGGGLGGEQVVQGAG